MLPFVFEDGFGFETYARYALDVPMYFVKRDGRYIDASGQSFRAFMAGELPILPGEKPTIKDWEDHLTTLFPEVRLKTYLEMRGADTGPKSMLCALAALWIGLLYDPASQAAAWDLCKDWTMDERQALRGDAARVGLKAQVAGRTVREIARDVLAIAREGLKRRNRLSGSFSNETGYLAELDEIVATGMTPADRLLDLYHGAWGGEAVAAYDATAY
jgi:glutamate--cysteine ligase